MQSPIISTNIINVHASTGKCKKQIIDHSDAKKAAYTLAHNLAKMFSSSDIW